MNLMIAESPGPDVSKLVPKVRDTAKYLYSMYIGLSLIQVVLLLAEGMPLFDTLTLTMGTAGTGGFAVRSSGFDDYTLLQQATIGVFMVAFGVNFAFYFYIVRHKYKQAFFTVASIITTTGYATVDFNQWTSIAKTLLLMLMFIGACAGSTGGGIKVSRFVITFKGIKKEIKMLLHPNLVEKVQMDGKPIAHETVRSINVFLSIYLFMFVIVLLIVSLDGKDMTTNFSAVAATINNIGPGLNEVGPMSTFAGFSNLSKIALSVAMLAGRLELLPIILLLVPGMWKGARRTTHREHKESKARAPRQRPLQTASLELQMI